MSLAAVVPLGEANPTFCQVEGPSRIGANNERMVGHRVYYVGRVTLCPKLLSIHVLSAAPALSAWAWMA